MVKKDLKSIDDSLVKLKDDFNKQIDAIDDDTSSFHNAMIDLTAKNPEHKELVQFIVFVNDKLETKHKTHAEVYSDTFNELITMKRDLLNTLGCDNETKSKEMGFFGKIFTSTKLFADVKMILISVAAIAIAIGVMMSPDVVLSVIKAIAELILG